MAGSVDRFVVQALAVSEAELLDRIVDLTIECDAYRKLGQEAIHALHAVMADRDRLRASQHRLIEECRGLRAQMREGIAA